MVLVTKDVLILPVYETGLVDSVVVISFPVVSCLILSVVVPIPPVVVIPVDVIVTCPGAEVIDVGVEVPHGMYTQHKNLI